MESREIIQGLYDAKFTSEIEAALKAMSIDELMELEITANMMRSNIIQRLNLQRTLIVVCGYYKGNLYKVSSLRYNGEIFLGDIVACYIRQDDTIYINTTCTQYGSMALLKRTSYKDYLMVLHNDQLYIDSVEYFVVAYNIGLKLVRISRDPLALKFHHFAETYLKSNLIQRSYIADSQMVYAMKCEQAMKILRLPERKKIEAAMKMPAIRVFTAILGKDLVETTIAYKRANKILGDDAAEFALVHQ